MLSTVRHKWRLCRNILSVFGWGTLLCQISLYLLQQIFVFIRIALVYCIDTEDIDTRSSQKERIEFTFVGPDEIDRVDEEMASKSGLAKDLLRPRLMRGDRCFIGMMNGTKCYFSIVSFNSFNISRRFSVRFSDEEAYVGNCYTLISHRGLGIYPAALQNLAQRLAVEGKKCLYLSIEFENRSSIRGVEKAGFYPVAKASVWGIGPILRRKWCFMPIDRDRYFNHFMKRWSIKTMGWRCKDEQICSEG
jgi:hypothetical protein